MNQKDMIKLIEEGNEHLKELRKREHEEKQIRGQEEFLCYRMFLKRHLEKFEKFILKHWLIAISKGILVGKIELRENHFIINEEEVTADGGKLRKVDNIRTEGAFFHALTYCPNLHRAKYQVEVMYSKSGNHTWPLGEDRAHHCYEVLLDQDLYIHEERCGDYNFRISGLCDLINAFAYLKLEDKYKSTVSDPYQGIKKETEYRCQPENRWDQTEIFTLCDDKLKCRCNCFFSDRREVMFDMNVEIM